MLINKTLFGTASLLPLIGFDAEGGAEGGGGTPAPTPAPAPAPSEPSLMGGEDGTAEGTDADGAADSGDGTGDGAGDQGGEQGEGGDGDEADGDAGKDGEGAGDEEAQGAPETYDFAEVLGENGVQLNEELLGEFTETLKSHNLTQEQANAYMGFAQKLQQSWLDQITQAHVDTRASWRKEAQADPEFGGDKFQENLATAKTVLDGFGSPELKQLLNETGVGDNPHFIRMMYKLGVVNRDHDFVKAGKPTKQVSFYDHPTSQPRK